MRRDARWAVILALPLLVPCSARWHYRGSGTESGVSGACNVRVGHDGLQSPACADSLIDSLADSLQLTPALLSHYLAVKRALIPFWRAHPALEDQAQEHPLSPTVQVLSSQGTPETKRLGVWDYVTLARADTALAHLFVQCKLRPAQFAPVQVAVYRALYTLRASEAAAPRPLAALPKNTSVAGRNIALVRAQRQALAAVGVAVWAPLAVGQRVPTLQVTQWLNLPAGAPVPAFGDGHIYVVMFTAHWCEACRQVYPVLDTVLPRYAGRPVRVLYVTQLFGYYGNQQEIVPAAEVDSLRAYRERHRFVGPLALIPSIAGSGYGPNGGGFTLPTLVVVDGQGKLRLLVRAWQDNLATQICTAVDSAIGENVQTPRKDSAPC